MIEDRVKELGSRNKEEPRKMKDSGVEWIGEIPKEWEVIKMKHLGQFSSSGIDKKIVEGEPLVRIINYTDVYGNKSMVLDNKKDYMIVSTSKDKVKKHTVKEGDLIFTPSSETIEDIGISALVYEELENTAFSYHVLRFQFNRHIDKEYKKYLCNNWYALNVFSSKATGTTRKILNRDDFKDLKVLLPNLQEQQAIANYLDSKVSQIDDIIEKTKQSIEDYKKYKQSLITETVTKGLNPDVEMKDSGIEWVGEVPEHWETVILNRLYSQIKERNKGLVEDNLLSLSYGKIVQRDINSNEGLLPESFEGYNIIGDGNIVLRLTDLQNDHTSLRVGLCTQTGIITSAYISLKGKGKRVDEYMYYYLHSFDIYKGFYGMGAGVRQSLTFDGIKNLKLLSPPIEEQQQIADYLDRKCLQIDKIIDQKKTLINELESYKKSLIYECVTGKRYVG